ncbi:hypothetical protein BKA01_000681 [Pseudonocardia eucalypti]|uniref:hypothetical protein n=1 Tax=Pseudonocardia eucalypti TaxID=648755 RepID=UPI0016218BF0|nr:hypothetical protein [Pseudonocardia eucalypti]
MSRGRHRYIEPEPTPDAPEEEPDPYSARHRYRPTQVHGPTPPPPVRDLREETVADLFAAVSEDDDPYRESAFSAHRVDDLSTPSRHSQHTAGPGATPFGGPDLTADARFREVDPLEDTGRIERVTDDGSPFDRPADYGRYRIYDGTASDTGGPAPAGRPIGGSGGFDAVGGTGGYGPAGEADVVEASGGHDVVAGTGELDASAGTGRHGIVAGPGEVDASAGTGRHGVVAGTGGFGAAARTGGTGAIGGIGAAAGTGGHRTDDDAPDDEFNERGDKRPETDGIDGDESPDDEDRPDADGAPEPEGAEEAVALEEELDEEPVDRKRLLRVKVLGAVAAVSLLACVPLGFGAWRANGSAELENRAFLDTGATAQLAGQVSDAMIAAYSYDFRNMAASESEARAVITGDFVAEFTRNFEPLKKVALEQQLVLQTTVPIAGVTDLRGDTARLLMMVNQHGTKGAAKEPIAVNAPLVVEARKVDGRWKIARVSPQ